MRLRRWTLLVAAIPLMGCNMRYSTSDNSQSLAPARKAAVEDAVRKFADTVAHDVTQDGPIAWRKYMLDSPAFFMAVNGKIEFPNGQAAAQAMPDIAGKIKRIELRWGDDLRVDALTENLCVIGASYTEVIESRPVFDAHPFTQHGFFTGLAESRNGKWQFRNAHWSVIVPTSKVP